MPLDDEVVVAALMVMLIVSTAPVWIVSGKSGGSPDNGFRLHSRVRRSRKGHDDDEKLSDNFQHPGDGRDRSSTTPEKTDSWAPRKRHVLKSD